MKRSSMSAITAAMATGILVLGLAGCSESSTNDSADAPTAADSAEVADSATTDDQSNCPALGTDWEALKTAANEGEDPDSGSDDAMNWVKDMYDKVNADESQKEHFLDTTCPVLWDDLQEELENNPDDPEVQASIDNFDTQRQVMLLRGIASCGATKEYIEEDAGNMEGDVGETPLDHYNTIKGADPDNLTETEYLSEEELKIDYYAFDILCPNLA